MLLTIDIGNTNTSFCIFNENTIVQRFNIYSDANKTTDEFGVLLSDILKNLGFENKISACAISSVVLPLGEVFTSAIKKYLNIVALEINHKIKMPFKIKIDNPKELGADRIANATYAVFTYKLPAIVIDFGTATTFDIINENKEFIGGLIAPGLYIQAQSLSKFTSKLPKLKIEAPKNIIGTNTIDAMLSGIVRGHSCMVDGMIQKSEKELKKTATIIACGGFSEVLHNEIERKFDFIDKDLTHKGLKMLWELNYGK